MMPTLTDDASRDLARYLKQVQTALRGHRSVDLAEVERDVIGHIEAELADAPQPVGGPTLRAVLERLGAPVSWVPDEELPPWRRALNRLWTGSEDWRLAYLSIALFLAAPVLFIQVFLWPLEPLLLIASFLTSRTALAVLAEHSEPVGARWWLLYPPLVTVYVAALAFVVAAPAPFVMQAWDDDTGGIRGYLIGVTASPTAAVVSLVVSSLAVWWIALGLLFRVRPSCVRVTFYPFAEWFGRRHATWFLLAGTLAVSIVVVLLAIAQ
jgi:hypothetical protein